MSYSVHVFPRALEAKFKKAKKRDLFEDEANLVSFDEAALDRILEQLELVGFAESKKEKRGRHFRNEEWPAEAVLTERGLYLSASGDGVFEILQFGSEMADETLAKYDPQEGTWE